MSDKQETTEEKGGLQQDLAASAYWRELHKDDDEKHEGGIKEFIKEEVEATGYFKHHPDKYPV